MNTIYLNYDQDPPKDYTGIVERDDGRDTYLNGKLHSFDDQPSIVYKNGFNEWHQNGKLHRVGFPAIVYRDGSCSYYLDGRLYRDNRFSTDNSIKSYWLRCWNEYRTPENEALIMARLLSAPK